MISNRISRHPFRAHMNGRAINVTNNGTAVDVRFGGTSDSRTVCAYVTGWGFIGGWQCLPKRIKVPPWSALADSINAGILYDNLNDLPGGRGTRRRRP